MAKFHKKASLIFLTAFTTASSVLQAVPVAIYAEETGEDANWLTPVNVTWTGNIYGSHTVDLAFDRVMQTGDNGFHSNGDALGRELTADLGAVYQLDKLEYYPRDDAGNGTMTKGDIAWSVDGINWQEQSVTWEGSSAAKTIEINACARYVRMIPREAVGDFFGATEIKIFKQNGTENTPSGTVNGAPYSQDTVALVKANLGLTAAENETNSVFSPFGALDVNYNGRLDVTDYAGLIRTINNSPALAASGNLYYKADRTVVESGDELTVTVMTEDANNITAMGGLFTFNADDFDLVAAEGQNPVQMTEWAGYMQNWSSATTEDGKTTINLAFVMEKDGLSYSGSHPIAQFTLRAKKTSKILTEEGSNSDLNIAQPLSRFGTDGNSADFTKCVFASLPVGDKATTVLGQSDFAITITKEGTQYATDDGNNVNVMVHQRNYDGLFNGDKGDRRFELMWASGGDPYNETIHKTPVDLHFALNTPQPLKSFVLYGGNQNEDGCVRKIGATVTFDDDSVYEFDGGIFDKPDTVFTFEIPSSMWSKNVKNIDLHIKQTRRSGVDGATIDQHLTLTEFEANAFANTEAVESIELTSNPASLKRGEAAPVTASVNPDSISHRGYTLTSSDPAVADVYYVTSEDGTISWNVEGVNAGTATITVTSTSNPDIHAEFEVTVSSERVADQVLQEALDHLRALDPNLIQAERKAEVDEILNTPIPENDAEFSKFLQSVLPVAADYLYRAPIENLLINKSADSGVTVESCIHNAALNQEGGTSGPAEKTLDKDSNTYYHSNYDSEANKRMPHWILYDLGDEYDLSDVTFLPRQHGNIGSVNGDVITAEIYASTDKDSLERIGEFTFEKYEDGVHIANRTEYHAMTFTPVRARYVKLNVLHTGGAGGTDMYTSIAEVNFYQPTDKSALKSAIAERDTLTESDYTQESWEAYVQAVTDGQTTVDTPTATQEEVDGAAAEINAKKDQLEREFTLTFQQDGEIKHTARLGENCTDEELAAVKEAAKNALTIEDGYVFVRWDTEPAKPTDDAVYNAVIKADTAALEDAIEVYEALENPEAIYTADSFASYTDAIETARELVNNGTESKEAVDSALAAIQSAIDNLEVTITFIDENGSHTIDFNATASADDVKNRAPTPAEKAGYNFDKWDPEFAAPTAPATYRAQYKLDYSPLTDAIEEMKDLPQDDYTDDSWQNLQTKIAEAQSTVDNKSLNNPEEVTAKVAELTAAADDLVRAYYITFLNTDDSELGKQKFAVDTSAEDVKSAAPVVPVNAGYRFEKWVSNEDGTSPVVAVTGTATYKAVVVVDKTALEAKIDAVNKEIADNSWTIDNFTDQSWNDLQTALTAANTVLNNPDASVEDVENALNALNKKDTEKVRAYVLTFTGTFQGTKVPDQTHKFAQGEDVSDYVPEGFAKEGYILSWTPALPTSVTETGTFEARWTASSLEMLEKNMVAYYPFNGNTDDHKGTRHGTADESNVSYTNESQSGQGIRLENYGRVDFTGKFDDLKDIDYYTLSYWVKADSFTNTSWITRSKDNTFATGFQDNNLVLNTNAGNNRFTIAKNLNAGQWYQATWVHTPAGMSLYLNGAIQKVGGSDVFKFVSSMPAYNRFPLSLDILGGSTFNGYIDELRIFDIALNAEEAKALYDGDQGKTGYAYTVTFKSELSGTPVSTHIEEAENSAASVVSAAADKFIADNRLSAGNGYVLVWKDEAGKTVEEFSSITENKTYILTKAVDLTELEEQIKALDELNLASESYTEESWQTYQTALDNAKAALVTPPATAEEVQNLAQALTAGYNGLVRQYEITFKYSENGEEKTKTVLLKENTTPEDVSKQAPEVAAPEGYIFNGWAADDDAAPIETVTRDRTYKAVFLVDKKELSAKLHEIITYLSDNNLEAADYTEATWNALESARTFGNAVVKDTAATVEDVRGALKVLNNAWAGMKRVYTLTFMVEGEATEVRAEQDGLISESYPEPEAREGYTFDGWYTSDAFGQKVADDAVVTSNQTIYGRYLIQQGTVTINRNDGSEAEEKTVNYNTELTLEDPVRAKYNFKGWYTTETFEAGTEWTSGTAVTTDLNLYAKWEGEIYTATFVYYEGKDNTTDQKEYDGKSSFTAPSEDAIKRTGYHFDGWFKDQEFTEPYDFTEVAESNITLYGKWGQRFTVTFDGNGGSWNGEELAPVVVDKDDKIAEPAKPAKEHYRFAGWFADLADEAAFDFDTPITEDLVLHAKWEAETYTATFVYYEGKDNTTDQKEYDGKSSFTAPSEEATNRAGYRFDGWYTDQKFTKPYDFTEAAEKNITLYGKWVQTFTVTFDGNGGSWNGNELDPAVVDKDDKIAEPEKPAKEHYQFAGWFADLADENAFDFENTPITSDLVLHAKWKAETYTATFVYYEGKDNTTNQKEYDGKSSFTAPSEEATTRTGYRFIGWYTDQEFTKPYDFTEAAEKNITLYGKWEQTFTVTFDGNGGSWDGKELDPVVVEKDDKIAEPAKPAKEHYRFAGWFADLADENAFDFENTPITGDLVLHAKWEAETYTATFVYYEGKDNTTVQQQYDGKSSFTAPSEDATNREKYHFKGWYTDQEFIKPYEFTEVAESNITLYGKWVETFTATFDGNGGSWDGKELDPVVVEKDDKIAEPAKPAREHYQFVGWFADLADKDPFDFESTPITGDLVLHAKWTPNDYTVTYVSNGGDKVEPETVTYSEDAKFAEPEDPTKLHHIFKGWYADKELTTLYSFDTPVTGSIKLYAKWEAVTYTATFDSKGGSEVDEYVVTYSDTAKFAKPTDPTRAYYTFTGWYVNDACTIAYSFDKPVTGDLTLYAGWNPANYTLTFESNGGSAVASQTVKYSDEAVFTEPGTPVKGHYTFAGWYTDPELNIPYDFVTRVTGDLTLYAKWTPQTYQVTFNSGEDASLVPAQKVSYMEKADVPPVPTKKHYVFAGWYYTPEGETDKKEYNFETPVTGNVYLFAEWTLAEYEIRLRANGGTVSESVIRGNYGNHLTKDKAAADADKTLTYLPTPERKGYKFEGWYKTAEFADNTAWDFANDTITGSMSLYAKWTKDPEPQVLDYTLIDAARIKAEEISKNLNAYSNPADENGKEIQNVFASAKRKADLVRDTAETQAELDGSAAELNQVMLQLRRKPSAEALGKLKTR